MNNKIEKELNEIFEEGKKLQAEIADFYAKVARFSKLVDFDIYSETMKADILKMHEALRHVNGLTMMY